MLRDVKLMWWSYLIVLGTMKSQKQSPAKKCQEVI